MWYKCESREGLVGMVSEGSLVEGVSHAEVKIGQTVYIFWGGVSKVLTDGLWGIGDLREGRMSVIYVCSWRKRINEK